jgi:death on curing protein
MITTEDILELHRLSIERFGGANGIRDAGLLESAAARPFQTFGGEDLYKTAIEKAAAIMESIIINHPFIDGNKRTAFLAMFAILTVNNYKLISSEEIAYTVTIKASTGEAKFEQIVEWLKQNTMLL